MATQPHKRTDLHRSSPRLSKALQLAAATAHVDLHFGRMTSLRSTKFPVEVSSSRFIDPQWLATTRRTTAREYTRRTAMMASENEREEIGALTVAEFRRRYRIGNTKFYEEIKAG